MAGIRIYITVPKRDWQLIRRLAMLGNECQGQWARRAVLTELYRELCQNQELLNYDIQLAAQERQEVILGRLG